jgi:hypothetical protein
VAEFEVVENRNYEDAFDDFKKMVKQKINTWASESKIESAYWYVWYKNRPLTNIGSNSQDDSEFIEKAEKSVRIMDSESQVSFPIIDYPPSLMKVLGNIELFALRVYVLIDEPNDLKKAMRTKLSAMVKGDLKEVAWK